MRARRGASAPRSEESLDRPLLYCIITVCGLRLIPSSAVPIYRQIVDQVADQIACGRLRVGDRLPSVRELAQALPANQNTILKAYEILEHEGLIARRHGDGTFVTSRASALDGRARRQVLGDLLGQVARKAVLFDVPAVELHNRLDEELHQVGQEQDGSAPPAVAPASAQRSATKPDAARSRERRAPSAKEPPP